MFSWLTLGALIKDPPPQFCTARSLHFLAKPLNNSLWLLPGSPLSSCQPHILTRLIKKPWQNAERHNSDLHTGQVFNPIRKKTVTSPMGGVSERIATLLFLHLSFLLFSAWSLFFLIMYPEQKLPHPKLLLCDHSWLPPSFTIHSTYRAKYREWDACMWPPLILMTGIHYYALN